MATCKDCIHHGVCGGFTPTDLDHDVFDYCREGRTDEILDIEQRCNHFADKSRFVELPCKIGDKVYRLSRQCGEWKILPRKVLCITYHGGTRWCLYTTKGDILGDNVFLTKADAEAEVAKRIENDRDRQ